MNAGRTGLTIVLLGGLAAGPAFAQGGAAAPPAAPSAAPSASNAAASAAETDDAFMTGLRRIGVMGGEVVQCATDADRQKPIADAMALSNQIALHFGLTAAFNFIGAVGYGAGKPFDKSGCAEANAGWNDIRNKYLK